MLAQRIESSDYHIERTLTMSHIRALSRRPQLAQEGEGVTTPLESAILLFLTIFFGDWINGPAVIQTLSAFYAKTPE